MTTVLPLGSRHGAGFVWSAPGHARASPPASPHVMPPASRTAQRSPPVNFTGNRTLCRKKTAERLWHRVQHLAHPGAVVGFRIRHRETTPPPISAACPVAPVDEHREVLGCAQNRLSPGDSGPLALMSNDPRSLRAQATDAFARW